MRNEGEKGKKMGTEREAKENRLRKGREKKSMGKGKLRGDEKEEGIRKDKKRRKDGRGIERRE